MDNIATAIEELGAALDETHKIRTTLRAVDMLTMSDDVGRVEHWICSVRATLSAMQREQALLTLPPLIDIKFGNMWCRLLEMLRLCFDYECEAGVDLVPEVTFEQLLFTEDDYTELDMAVRDKFGVSICGTGADKLSVEYTFGPDSDIKNFGDIVNVLLKKGVSWERDHS